jgi:hypothetical protein
VGVRGDVDAGALSDADAATRLDATQDARQDVLLNTRQDALLESFIGSRIGTRTGARFDGRFDTRQDTRQDVQQAIRQDIRQRTRQDQRYGLRLDTRFDTRFNTRYDVDPGNDGRDRERDPFSFGGAGDGTAESVLNPSWLRETIATAATGGDLDEPTPTTERLESFAAVDQATGDLPTGLELFGSEAEQEAFADVAEFVSFGRSG